MGTDALTEANKRTVAPLLKGFVAAGNTAVVLDQTFPLVGTDLPLEAITIWETPTSFVTYTGPGRKPSRRKKS